eukprot:g16809.t1
MILCKAPGNESGVQLSVGDEDVAHVTGSAGRTPVSKKRRHREVVGPVWTVPGDDTREYSERYNPGEGDCGPYAVGQLASNETPSAEELKGYRRGGVEHVLETPIMDDDHSWEGNTPEERKRSRQDWAKRMTTAGECADYRLMLGMRAVYCGDVIFVQPRLPELSEALLEDDGSNPGLVLKAFASEVADPASSMLAKNKRWIDEAFGTASSVEEIVRRLEGMMVPSADRSGREWAQTALDSLAKASPTALKVDMDV